MTFWMLSCMFLASVPGGDESNGAPAFCFLHGRRIRSGKRVMLGGTQTYPPKKGRQRSESGSGSQLLGGERRWGRGSRQAG